MGRGGARAGHGCMGGQGAEGWQGEVARRPQDKIDSLDTQFIFTFQNISFEYNLLLWLVGSDNMSPVRA